MLRDIRNNALVSAFAALVALAVASELAPLAIDNLTNVASAFAVAKGN